VQKAIDTLSGGYLVGLSTTGSVAGQVLSFVQRGFAPEYIDEYPQLLQAITAEQVNRTIRQHLKPQQHTLVVAGSLNSPQDAEPASIQKQQDISIRLDTPDAGWSIEIDKVYRTSESIVVLSQLQHSGDIAAAVISTVSDNISIPSTDQALPVRHYILGKKWDWGISPDYTFIDSIDAFGAALDRAELLYEK
jgi:zinc protease